MGRDDVYIDFNLSKVQFKKEDEALFQAVLDSISVDEKPEPPREKTSLEYWMEGGRFFAQQRNYKASIAPYEKALELEKKKRSLSTEYWYVLIDNLGMAHGITGNLERAKEVFEHGISQDPKYPLFYYNLACTYGEMGEKEKAMQQLELAFKHKGNVIAGERMPDPRTDSSFKRFMKDRDFREFADRLMK